MKLIEYPEITDPVLNLAIEEYLLRNVCWEEPLLFIYVNDPSVIIGRNQNVFQEVHPLYLQESKIPLLRRLSGGGAVFHDRGNLNYSLITPAQGLLNDFVNFTRPVVEALARQRLLAELRNRSSIFVNGKKVSGNAQYASSAKLISHGTLLVDADLTALRRAVTPRNLEVESRAIQSIRSPVANLNEFLERPLDVSTMRRLIIQAFGAHLDRGGLTLGEEAWIEINRFVQERYSSWSWNFGRSPKSRITRRCRKGEDEYVIHLTIDHGHIQRVEVNEDEPWGRLHQSLFRSLEGTRYDLGAIEELLDRQLGGAAPAPLTLGELLDLVY